MSEPIVLISHFQIREGKLGDFKQRTREASKQLRAKEPRTLVFLTYVSENEMQMTAVFVFPDAESMDLHFQSADERSRAAYEVLIPSGSWEVYGTPSDRVLEMMRREATASGIALTVQVEQVAGFLRTASS